MRPLRPVLYVPLVLLSLLALIISPPLLAGWQAENRARQAAAAGEYTQAASYYESAAQRLPWRPDLWEQAGLAALSGGDPHAAFRLFNKTEIYRPLSRQGKIALGDAYEQTGDLDSAIYLWQDVLAAYGPEAAVHDRLARAHHVLGDYAAEEDDLRALLALQPQDASAHYRLGLLLAASRPAEALPELMLAANLDPELDPSVQVLRVELNTAQSEDDPAYQLVISGRALAAIGEWELAVVTFAQAAAIRAEYAEAWAWLGEALQNLGQDGLPYLDRALRLDPDSVLVRALRGLYWQRQNEAKMALLEFQAAADLEPDNPAWQAALGDAYAQAGDLPPALEAYQRAVVISPNDPIYKRLLAVFCVQYDVQVKEIGLPTALQAINLAPDDAQARDVAGWAYLTLGQLDDAEKQLNYAVKLDPNLASAHLHLAILYLQQGQKTLAHNHLLRALDLSGDGLVGEQAKQMLDHYYP